MAQPFVFFGSSPYSVPVLDLLISTGLTPTLVVTSPDKPVGRHLKLTPNPAKILAVNSAIPVVEKFADYLLQATSFTSRALGLVAAFGRIIPTSVLNTFNNHIYNIHPSLLPKYRGASPLQFQILEGITDAGVSLFQLDPEMDHGPIISQVPDQLLPTDTPETLGKRLFTLGTSEFIRLFPQLLTGTVPSTPQDHNQATFTRLLTREDGFIPYDQLLLAFQNNSPVTLSPMPLSVPLDRAFRALYPWPGLWSITPASRRVKVVSVRPPRVKLEGNPNVIAFPDLLYL